MGGFFQFLYRVSCFFFVKFVLRVEQGAPKAREVNLVRDPYFQVALLASG